VDLLFNSGALSDFLERRKKDIKEEISAADRDYLLKVSESDYCEYLTAKHALDAPHLLTDERYALEPQEVSIDVSQDFHRAIAQRNRPYFISGTEITVVIPFEGSAELFKYTPSTRDFNPPCGTIRGHELYLAYRKVDPDRERIQNEIQQDLHKLTRYLRWVNDDVSLYNKKLPDYVTALVKARRKRLLDDMNLASGLGIPIKRRGDAPPTYSVPTVMKKPQISRPDVSPGPYRPEPVLSEADYERILDIISSMVDVMERSPRVFADLTEEDIRTHFLVQLNGQYEGRATGETFNYKGKTDILIRESNRSVFIAECKFWHGPGSLTKAIDQVLGYASWRDTKTAILLFNRGTTFTRVLEQIPEVVCSHPSYKGDMVRINETTYRFTMHQSEDVHREVLLTVMAFNLPTKT